MKNLHCAIQFLFHFLVLYKLLIIFTVLLFKHKLVMCICFTIISLGAVVKLFNDTSALSEKLPEQNPSSKQIVNTDDLF